MKKILSLVLAAATALTMFTSCGQKPQNTESSDVPMSSSEIKESKEFEIYYPSYMQKEEGEKLVLPKKPEKIIVLSNSAMQILIRCDIKPIAFRKPTPYVEWPEWVEELPMISTDMNGVDLETVVSMEPDLVIMGNHLKEDYDGQLKEAGIPVYYTSEGPSVAYPEVKEEAIVLTRSFGSEEMAEEVKKEFEAVEKRAEDLKNSSEIKKAMILFGAPPSYQQTSMSYLGSILSMMPFENISDSLVSVENRMAPIDLEKLVEINPDVIFAISPTAPSSEALENLYKEEYEKNPKIWNALSAVQNDKVIYLSGEYVTSKGIRIIKSMNNLMDMIEGKAVTDKSSVQTTGVTIAYPDNMKEKGFTEPLVLEKTPENVVVMSKAPVLALHELGVKMKAIPKGGVITWPEDLDKSTEKLDISMNSNFDIETVVALEPDLVIMGHTSQEKYGQALKDAGIPVYYVDAGHTVPYESVKAQTQEFVNAFNKNSDLMKRFEELENRMEGIKTKYADKKVMVLQSAPPSHYIQTKEGTLASMADMIGFKNVYENDKTAMAPLDLEKAVEYEPDLILAVGMSNDPNEHKKMMEEEFAKNPDYWNSIEAVKKGNMICFSSEFIASTGIGFIDSMNDFIDIIESFYSEM